MKTGFVAMLIFLFWNINSADARAFRHVCAVDDGLRELPLLTCSGLFRDGTRSLGFSEVKALMESEKFEALDQSSQEISGYRKEAFWIHFELLPRLSTPQTFYVGHDFRGARKVTFYVNDGGSWKEYHSGFERMHRSSGEATLVNGLGYYLPILLHPGRPTNLFIRIDNDGSSRLIPTLRSRESLLQSEFGRTLGMGLAGGAILLLALGACLLFSQTRQRSFLLFAAYLSAYVLAILGDAGILANYLQFLPWKVARTLYLDFWGASFFFLNWFVFDFLNVREWSRRSRWLSLGAAALAILPAVLLHLGQPNLGAMGTTLSGMVVLFIQLLVIGVAVRRKVANAPALLVALAPLSYASIFVALTRFGWVQMQQFATVQTLLCGLWQLLVLFWVLQRNAANTLKAAAAARLAEENAIAARMNADHAEAVEIGRDIRASVTELARVQLFLNGLLESLSAAASGQEDFAMGQDAIFALAELEQMGLPSIEKLLEISERLDAYRQQQIHASGVTR